MRIKLLWCFVALFCASDVTGRDYLDTFGGRGWSPDGQWLAINPVNQNELFFIPAQTGRSYMLRPLVDLDLDTRGVFSSAPSKKQASSDPVSLAQAVPSPGLGKLEMVEWAPDSRTAAYQVDRKTRAVFSVVEGAVTSRIDATKPLPWNSADDLRLAFELVAGSGDRAARYWLRILRTDGKIVKEVSFGNPREIRQMSLLRFGEAAFLSPNKQFLLYPRLTEKGWQLMQDPITGDAPARALTGPTVDPPVEWKLTKDCRYLAVAEDTYTLTVGELADWAKAEKVPLGNLSVTMNWSPDGRFLACSDKQQLYLLIRDNSEGRLVKDFVMVSDICAPQFWGWRGARLYFGDARTDPTNVFCIDTDKPNLKPQAIVKARNWHSAPREISISPDGKTMVCLVFEFDSEGRSMPQLWKVAVRPDAQWELMYSFRP